MFGDRLSSDRKTIGEVRGCRRAAEASAARMLRRVGSARAMKTCSAIASMSGGIEVVEQLAQLVCPALGVPAEGLAVGVLR